MPTTDYKRDERIRIIDQCLQNTSVNWTLKKIHEKVSDFLWEEFKTSISERSINDDLNYLIEHKFAPIEKRRDGRYIYYYYEENFELHAPIVDKDEYLSLAVANDILKNLKGFPLAKDLKRILEKVQHQVEVDANSLNTFIQFEEQPELKNINLLQELFECIKEETVLNIQYKGFKSDEIIIKTIHPYLLKQYNKRWFLFGYDAQFDRIDNSPLDRIVKIKPTNESFVKVEFDASEYFKDVVGVTKYVDSKIETILFSVTKERVDYVLTKPIHASQKVVSNNDDGSIDLCINVIPNNELLQQLLSFGKDIKVKAPSFWVDKIKNEFEMALNSYKH